MSASRRFAPDVLLPKNWTAHHMLRAFRYRNYRLFFTGQAVSLVGLWMQRVAMSWLIYRLTNSPLHLGMIDFAGQIPVLFLGFFAGALLEGWDLKRTIIICQILSTLQAFLLALLTFTGTVAYWHVLLLSIFLGLVNAFEVPARQSFVVHMVDRPEDVGNAIALNSSLFNSARLLGPSLAGVVIATAGEAICFLANALSYGTSLTALLMMRIPPRKKEEKEEENTSIGERVGEGIRYAWHNPPIRAILLTLVVLSICGLPYLVMLPIFARDILQGGPKSLGFLLGATGVGALIASIRLAMRPSPVGLGKTLGIAACLFGTGITLFSASRWFLLSLPLMGLIGFGMVSLLISCNTLLQTLVEENKRSRIMSLYIISVMGISPFGSLITGWTASHLGAPLTLGSGGVICVLAGVLFLRNYPKLWE
ncbi:MAG TPA: MFS transporter, partial [Synergistaceae bacterium]|nr:MFS transporter [Synergistaceae bacterium]